MSEKKDVLRQSGRNLRVRVKTARGRRTSSTRWLQRQINDPYVTASKRDGFRSRAAYKLIELNDRFSFFSPGAVVLDLGAAPGSWSQVAREKIGLKGSVVAVDKEYFESIPKVDVMFSDVYETALALKLEILGYKEFDVVLSDMAPSASGHKKTDHLKIISLVEAAYRLSQDVLATGGVFVAKVWQGGTENELLRRMRKEFETVRHVKPKASRSDSAEIYLVARGFKSGNV